MRLFKDAFEGKMHLYFNKFLAEIDKIQIIFKSWAYCKTVRRFVFVGKKKFYSTYCASNQQSST